LKGQTVPFSDLSSGGFRLGLEGVTDPPNLTQPPPQLLARDNICYSALYAIARPSVVCHTGGSVKDG